MGKSKRRRSDETEEERHERLLMQIQDTGRLPTPPPGKYHDTDKRRDRRAEKRRVRDVVQVDDPYDPNYYVIAEPTAEERQNWEDWKNRSYEEME